MSRRGPGSSSGSNVRRSGSCPRAQSSSSHCRSEHRHSGECTTAALPPWRSPTTPHRHASHTDAARDVLKEAIAEARRQILKAEDCIEAVHVSPGCRPCERLPRRARGTRRRPRRRTERRIHALQVTRADERELRVVLGCRGIEYLEIGEGAGHREERVDDPAQFQLVAFRLGAVVADLVLRIEVGAFLIEVIGCPVQLAVEPVPLRPYSFSFEPATALAPPLIWNGST